MNILAIDPATRCGWAHTCGSWGTWDLSIRRDESSGMRLIRFRAKLTEILYAIGADVIAYETPSVARGKKANMDGLKLGSKLQGIIEELAESTPKIECIGYNLQSIKKHAGCRTKDEMVEAARRIWRHVDDDNQADALFLLALAHHELDPHGGYNAEMAVRTWRGPPQGQENQR